MQVLFAKEFLVDLAVSVNRSRVGPGDVAILVRESDDMVAVFINQPSLWPLWRRMPKPIRLGNLNASLSRRISTALNRGARMKAWVVIVEPRHLEKDGVDKIAISIWGHPESIETSKPRFSIFSTPRMDQFVEKGAATF